MKIQTQEVDRVQQKCRYDKIPLRAKIKLFKQVFQKGLPIRMIAKDLKIKYSTAKTLIRQFKYNRINVDLNLLQDESQSSNKHQQRRRCEYRDIAIAAAPHIPSLRRTVQIPCKSIYLNGGDETLKVKLKNRIQIISTIFKND